MVRSEDEPFFEFTWTISNFSLCRQKRQEFLDSPTFAVKFLQDTEWHLRLHPMGLGDANKIVCFLHRTQLGVDKISVQYSICLDDSNCEVRQTFWKKSVSEKCVKVSRDRYLGRVVAGGPDDLMVTCRLRPTQRQAASVSQAPYPPVCCSAVTTIPAERRKISWRIAGFSSLPSQHEVAIPVVSASLESPKLLVTLSWSDETLKSGGGLQLEIREMPELVGKTFHLGLLVQMVDGKSKRHRLARGGFLFKTVQKNYWLWVRTYSDSVWNVPLAVDREALREKGRLQEGALVLECDFALSYDPVTSCMVSSGYVHPEPEPKEVDVGSAGNRSSNGWREVLLRNFNDQTSAFKFFFMLFVFLAIISRVFNNDN